MEHREPHEWKSCVVVRSICDRMDGNLLVSVPGLAEGKAPATPPGRYRRSATRQVGPSCVRNRLVRCGIEFDRNVDKSVFFASDVAAVAHDQLVCCNRRIKDDP